MNVVTGADAGRRPMDRRTPAARLLARILLAGAAVTVSGCSGDELADAAGKVVATARTALGFSDDADKPAGGRAARKRAHLVELAEVETGSLRITSVYTGSLRSRRTVRIYSQEEGTVTALPYFEGDRVDAGETVLGLDDTLLRVQLEKTVAVRKETEATLARLAGLRAKRMVSEDDYVRAVTAVEVAKAEEAVLRTRLGYTRVEAPFAGVVAERLVEPGDVVPRHAHVLTLIDPTSLVTDLEVSEILMPHLAVGSEVTVRIDALGDREFAGEVLRIHPELNARTRQGRVEVELRPVPERARPGQFARVTFAVEATQRKVIPFSALRRDRDGEYVFRVVDDLARRVPVRSGRRLADRVEVVEGLEDGDRVVVRGFLGLSDGMQVTPNRPPKKAAAES